MTLELPARVAAAPGVMAQELGSETVLLVLETGHYYGLDEVGSRMWHLLKEHDETGLVVDRLLDEYMVDRATLEQDLARFIGELAAAGLLTVAS